MHQRKTIEVISYNPSWPQQFEGEATQIKQALGAHCIVVHHIGSTSIPGLAAKPIIDILTVIADASTLIVCLEKAGFVYKGEWNIPFKYGFTKRGNVEVNLHVYEKGHPEIELNLLFRDTLRKDSSLRDAYAALKKTLLQNEASFYKKNGIFTGYTLGKDVFIRRVLNGAGFNRIRFLKASQEAEWEVAKRLRQSTFFDKVSIADPYTWTFTHEAHAHLVFYQGTEIIGYAHIQFWPESRAALRIIVTEEAKRNQGFGGKFLELIERWLQKQGTQSIHTEASPEALAFYNKHGYSPMPFQDPDGHESDPRDVAVGKKLIAHKTPLESLFGLSTQTKENAIH